MHFIKIVCTCQGLDKFNKFNLSATTMDGIDFTVASVVKHRTSSGILGFDQRVSSIEVSSSWPKQTKLKSRKN